MMAESETGLVLDADALVADIERTLSNYFKSPTRVGEAAAAVLLVVEGRLRQDRERAVERICALLDEWDRTGCWPWPHEGDSADNLTAATLLLAAAEGRG